MTRKYQWGNVLRKSNSSSQFVQIPQDLFLICRIKKIVDLLQNPNHSYENFDKTYKQNWQHCAKQKTTTHLTEEISGKQIFRN